MPVPYIFADDSGSVPASQLDANFQYILDNAVLVNNPNVFTALQSMSGAAFNEAKGADVPSAATLNLSTVTGNYVTVSGTNTVTAVTLASGAMRMIRATGAFTWTNNASIVVQGGANYTASVGDFFIVRGDASSVVYVLVFPASGDIGGSTGTGAVVRAVGPTMTLPNATGLPIATGVSGLGTGVATFLATPSSANLRAALSDETGAGVAVFNDTPTLVTPNIGAATGTSLTTTGVHVARNGTATPAAASAVAALSFGASNLGLYWGSGDPNGALTAAQASLYLRTDGSSSSTRIYVNTNGTTGWTNVTTAT